MLQISRYTPALPAWWLHGVGLVASGACVSSLSFFKEPKSGFKEPNRVSEKPIALGALCALFLWLGFSVC